MPEGSTTQPRQATIDKRLQQPAVKGKGPGILARKQKKASKKTIATGIGVVWD